MTTWNVVSVSINDNGIATLSIQEVVDTIPGRIYSASKHKIHGKAGLLKDLRIKIKKDRNSRVKNDGMKNSIDLTNFELSIGT